MTPMPIEPFSKPYPQELLVELSAGYWGFVADTTGYYITIDEGTLCANGAPIYWLPPGSWEIVCLAKDCSREVAAQIVESSKGEYLKTGAEVTYYKHYQEEYKHFVSPLDSMVSLLRAKGLEKEKTLILKKLQ